MGYTTSTVHGIEVPDSAEANNVPEDIGKVVTALEGGSIIRRLSQAQIDALTGPQKPAGLVVFNTTTQTLQVSNGSTLTDVGPALHAIGVRTASSQTVPTSASVTVSYSSEADPSNLLSGGVVTVPVGGLWMVAGSVLVTSTAATWFRAALVKGTVWSTDTLPQRRAITELPSGETTYRGYANISGLFVAAAGDTFEFDVANESSSVAQSITQARFSVVKVG